VIEDRRDCPPAVDPTQRRSSRIAEAARTGPSASGRPAVAEPNQSWVKLELTDFDLPTAIENALTLIRERAGRRSLALHMTVDEGLGQVRADERKIRQVVLNLLSNSITFTPEGGRIDVRAAPVDGLVEVSVSDTGVGIAPEDQEAVFEEFRQVGNAAKKVEGTGLGLALSRKFIELHGGRIWLKSEVGWARPSLSRSRCASLGSAWPVCRAGCRMPPDTKGHWK